MEENTPQLEASLQSIFDQSLFEPQSFSPEALPSEWTVGQHRYIRVVAEKKDTLDKKLTEFRELGVSVLDFGQRWGFWIFKTMAPKSEPS